MSELTDRHLTEASEVPVEHSERGEERAPDGARSSPSRSNHSVITHALLKRLKSKEIGVVCALLVILFGTGIPNHGFLSVNSLANIAQSASFYGIMAIGMVFLLAMGEVDLSVGSNYALTMVIIAIWVSHGLNAWIGAVLGILVGGLLGMVNGLIANIFRLPVLIVSLGTLTAYSGLAYYVTNDNTISISNPGSFFSIVGKNYLSVSFIVYAFVVLTILLSLVFRMTRFGFAVRAIGANPRAAVLSGYRVGVIRLMTTGLLGALCGAAAMLTLAFFAAADPSQGGSYNIEVIAAAIIGGTALTGGSGTVGGALLGALLISLISSSLIQFGISANASGIVTGVVIIAAVCLDATIRRARSRAST
jgi:ribose transport system permease protein